MNYYEILRVDPQASAEEIMDACRAVEQMLGSRVNSANARVIDEQIKELQEIRSVLTDPERRVRYDASIGISLVSSEKPPSVKKKKSSRNEEEKISTATKFKNFKFSGTFILIGGFIVYWALQNRRSRTGEWASPPPLPPSLTTKEDN